MQRTYMSQKKGAMRAQLLVHIENIDAVGYYQYLNWEATQLQAHRMFLYINIILLASIKKMAHEEPFLRILSYKSSFRIR